MDRRNGTFERLAFVQNRDGTFWLGTVRGLNHFDPSTACFTSYYHDPNDPTSLADNQAVRVYIDSEDQIWVAGGFNGLNRLIRDAETGTVSFEHYLPGRWFGAFLEDRSGRFWLGSRNAGLFLFDRKTGLARQFTREDGLPESMVMTLLEDNLGNLWMNISNQVVRFEPDTETFFAFDNSDGLPDITFGGITAYGAARGIDGTLYFGGQGGVVAFDPAPPAEDPAPKTTLMDRRLFNNSVVRGPDAVLDKPLYQTEQITLSHTQSDFTITYQGLDYRRPGRIRYQYTLEGLDVGWVATDINELVSKHLDLTYHGKRAQMPGLQVEIGRDLADDVGEVEVVPPDIGRVLLNLFGNAVDAMQEKAQTAGESYQPGIRVQTRRIVANGPSAGAIEIRVTDNGPGIPKDIREKIFEPFFTTRPTGTGLGLSLSYDIITQGHSGTLEMESTEGEGATFIITLPC
jgi:hypothetical protein